MIPSNHFPAKPLMVYVAGPYSRGLFDENIANVADAADKLASAGLVPFVPHTLTFLWAVRHQRPADFWYEFDLKWLERCDMLLRLPGESSGSDREVKEALELGIRVFTDIDELIAEGSA